MSQTRSPTSQSGWDQLRTNICCKDQKTFGCPHTFGHLCHPSFTVEESPTHRSATPAPSRPRRAGGSGTSRPARGDPLEDDPPHHTGPGSPQTDARCDESTSIICCEHDLHISDQYFPSVCFLQQESPLLSSELFFYSFIGSFLSPPPLHPHLILPPLPFASI